MAMNGLAQEPHRFDQLVVGLGDPGCVARDALDRPGFSAGRFGSGRAVSRVAASA